MDRKFDDDSKNVLITFIFSLKRKEIGNLMGISKMCLKQSFPHSKLVLHTILSLTVFSNCVSGSSNFDTTFLTDCTKTFSFFFRLLDRKFN